MTSASETLPVFTYFPDPVGYGCIVNKASVCPCCEKPCNHMYIGPLTGKSTPDEVCPWCIADGSAAKQWSAMFNEVVNVPAGVPAEVVEEILGRTPGYWTWQGNAWLFSDRDAMLLLGAVDGSQIVKEDNPEKIEACMTALRKWTWNFDLTIDFLKKVVPYGAPAIHLFQDRHSGAFVAYADMT